MISGSTVVEMIMAAYGVSYWQISSVDDWIKNERFNLDARPGEETRARVRSLRYSW